MRTDTFHSVSRRRDTETDLRVIVTLKAFESNSRLITYCMSYAKKLGVTYASKVTFNTQEAFED